MKNNNKIIKKIIISGFATSIWISLILLFSNANKIIKSLLFVFILFLAFIFIISKEENLKKINKYIYIAFMVITLSIYPIITVIHLYSFKTSTNFGWRKESIFPVLGNLSTKSLFDPSVIADNDGTYKMYVSYRKKGSIAISISDDGKNWSEMKTALSGNPNNEWEKTVNRCSVLYKNNKYIMYYTGQYNDTSKIGIAESKDGYNFVRIQDEPIIVPDKEYEKKSVMNPYVIFDETEKIYKMWYAAGENYEPDVIAYATSEDGINWLKYENNPIMTKGDNGLLDNYKVGACEVHKLDDNIYLMFYIGYTDVNTARILVATSKDGINWSKKNNKAIIEGTYFGFDANATYKPTAIYNQKNNEWMLWYNGRLVHREYIGFATCNIKEFWK